MTGFYMKCNTEMKSVNLVFLFITLTMQLLASLLPKLMRFLSTNRIVLKIPSLDNLKIPS